MNKYCILLSCLLPFSSCVKDPDCSKPSGIYGEWEWVQSFGGFGGWKETPESAGYRLRLEIDDLHYRQYKNDSLIFESPYDLVMRPDSVWDTNTYLEFETGGAQAYQIRADTLFLYDLCADCFDHTYIRK